MTDHRRMHPDVDLEAGRMPSVSLVTGNASRRSNKGRRNCCCRCMCYTFLTITVLAIVVAATLGALYLVFEPKLPVYTVKRLAVTYFDMDNNLTARARFDVMVRAENPNKAIGISYEDGSSLSVWYKEYRLSEGALPVFYQGHGDTMVMKIRMSEAQLGSTGFKKAMHEVQQLGGAVPVVLKADVPVRVKLGRLMLRKVTPSIRCNLVVDRLNVDSPIRVKTFRCKFRGLKL